MSNLKLLHLTIISESLTPKLISSFNKFNKLSNIKGFIAWRRYVRDILKALGLWKWTEETNRYKLAAAPLGAKSAETTATADTLQE